MPFKSEAQRRYLWAREPKIARDWTDTYGSRIQKENGGITRLGFQEGNNVDEEPWWRKGLGRGLASIVGLASDIPFLGSLVTGFPNTAEEDAMEALYGGNKVMEGPMAGYNTSSALGKGLPYATQKRIDLRRSPKTMARIFKFDKDRQRRFELNTQALEAELQKQKDALQAQSAQVPTVYRDTRGIQGEGPRAHTLSELQNRQAAVDRTASRRTDRAIGQGGVYGLARGGIANLWQG